MNFDVLVTLMVAISTYQTGMCYPNRRTKVNPQAQRDVIATTQEATWRKPMDRFKLRDMPSIRKIEEDVLNFDMLERKRRFGKKWTGCDAKVYLKIVDNVKDPVHHAVTSLSHLRKKEINPSYIVIQPEKLDKKLKSIMNSLKAKATTKMYNLEYDEEDKYYYGLVSTLPSKPAHTPNSLEPPLRKTMRTIAPKKLKLLKALIKRFRVKTTTDISRVNNKIIDRFAKKTTILGTYITRTQKTKNTYLSLKEFDHIFTPSTVKNNNTDSEIIKHERLSAHDMSSYLNSESPFGLGINKIMTENYKPILSDVRNGEHKPVIVGTSLNSLAEMNVTKFITKLKNSHPGVLPATPITLILNEDNDDIVISNNTLILPVPIFGKYARKGINKNKLFNSGPIAPEDRKENHFNMSNWNDIKATEGEFNNSDHHSLIAGILYSPTLMQSYINDSFVPILTNLTEIKPSNSNKVDQDKTISSVLPRPILKENLGSNISVIKLLFNYKYPHRNFTDLLPDEGQSMVFKPLLNFKNPYQESVHTDTEILKTDQGSVSAFMSLLSGIEAVKNPSINIYSYNVSLPNSTSINRIRNIWEKNKIFSKIPLNRLNEIKRLLNGTDEFLAIPLEELSSEYIHLLPNNLDYIEDRGLKDQLFSGQMKMDLDKYVYDRDDCCNTCRTKRTTQHHHHHHRKVHPTRFGMHIDNKHVISCCKCSQPEIQNSCTHREEDSGLNEEEMPAICKTSIQKWKCTCRKGTDAFEKARYKTKEQNYHSLKTFCSAAENTMKIYDEEEINADYSIDTTKTEIFEENRNNNKFEEIEAHLMTHRPVEAQGHWDCPTTYDYRKENPIVTGPSRQDIIVSIMCGAATCTECTMNEGDDSLIYFPENMETDSCLGGVKKVTTCLPLEETDVLSEEEKEEEEEEEDVGPTICTPPAPTCFTMPPESIHFTLPSEGCFYWLSTKKRRCTCACLCETKSQYLGKKHAAFATKSRIHETNRKNHRHICPHMNYNPLVLKLMESKKRSTRHCPNVMHAAHSGSSTINTKPLEEYYTVTDIELIDYFSKKKVHHAFNENENKYESDRDYWISDITTDISLLTDFLSFRTSKKIECNVPQKCEQIYKTKCIDITPSTVGRRCFCSRKKKLDLKKSRNKKICYDNSLEEIEDNYNRIVSKYVGKYKTFGLDSSDITNGLKSEAPIAEYIIPGYKKVTRVVHQKENPHWLKDYIKSMTLGTEELDLDLTETKPLLEDDSLPDEITTQDHEGLIVTFNESTPHSFGETVTFHTTTTTLHNGQEVQDFLSTNNLRKQHVKNKNSQLKVKVHSTKPTVFVNKRKKNHSPIIKISPSINFLKKTNHKSHLANQVEAIFKPNDERQTDMNRIITVTTGSNPPMESEAIFQPKEIVKSNEIASVKISFGTNKEYVKKNKKTSFKTTKKFFSFETKL
ncbi:unnamed protein product [Nezara viridula]|uniref:Neuropeptide n=1 Tax=Nezara viridula TaxID=85310 RepID=A0A9P0E349_NEZVI|nr:unnamed protein product [Nezara viridula]